MIRSQSLHCWKLWHSIQRQNSSWVHLDILTFKVQFNSLAEQPFLCCFSESYGTWSLPRLVTVTTSFASCKVTGLLIYIYPLPVYKFPCNLNEFALCVVFFLTLRVVAAVSHCCTKCCLCKLITVLLVLTHTALQYTVVWNCPYVVAAYGFIDFH